MHFEFPGLKKRPNKNGLIRLYWIARADIAKLGYRPNTVPIHYDWNDLATHPLISSACLRLQAEMLEWSTSQSTKRKAFDGTIVSLVARYQTDEASPYKRIKWNTRRTYDQVLGVIVKAVGARSLARLSLEDFRR